MIIDTSIIFLLGIAIFIVASVYFLLAHKKDFNSAFLVSFITIISYVLMFEGSVATASLGGEAIFVTRWIFYGLSCTLLMYEIGKLLELSLQKIIFLLYLTIIVMLTGAGAAYFNGIMMISLFAISSITYILLIYPLLTSKSDNRKAVAKYIILGWTGFPLVFIFAPDGYGLLSAGVAVALYLLLDVFTKVVFYLDLQQRMSAK